MIKHCPAAVKLQLYFDMIYCILGPDILIILCVEQFEANLVDK